MYVGLLVLPTGNTQLRSGGSAYECAVVVSLNPLKLSSLQGDMLWSATVKDMSLHGLCEAHPNYVANGMRRLPDEERSLKIEHLVGPEGKVRFISPDEVDVSHVLDLVPNPETAHLFPEFASVYASSKYQLFYRISNDQIYLRRHWQTWAMPLGKEYNYEWFLRMKAIAEADGSVFREPSAETPA